MIRQPIVAIMGHVDHGKTLLLDSIRGTAIAAKEAGGITQAIGASIIPLETIKSICGELLAKLKVEITLSGLLFIDTPGHAAFTNMRKRGGNLADIAILVIDITEGIKPQTKECLEILKAYKTPFIVALNKIDLISGWKAKPKTPFLKNLEMQGEGAQRIFETKLYDVVGRLFELGFESDRFDRVGDYTKQIALVPVSAKTAEGIPELLMVLTGLAQKYLEQSLKIDVKGQVKGTILEVKEQVGLGTVLDTIIYDGTLSVNDPLLIGGLKEPTLTRVKALFEPVALAEMREKKAKFKPVKKVHAATGVRIVAPGVGDVVAGMPIMGVVGDIEKLKAQIQEEVEEVLIETEQEGLVLKADSLGSLEALTSMFKEHNIPIRKASIGPITKKDLSDAEALAAKTPLYGVILGFNIPKPETVPQTVKVIIHDVIYKLIDDYEVWKIAKQKEMELEKIKGMTQPCKLEILKGYVFRQSHPAIVGTEIIAGTLRSNTPLMNPEGKQLTIVKGIQLEQKNIEEAGKGKQVAISLPGVTIGRQIKEGDTLYSAIAEQEFRTYKEYKALLSEEQKALLKEIAEIMRKKNPVWGI